MLWPELEFRLRIWEDTVIMRDLTVCAGLPSDWSDQCRRYSGSEGRYLQCGQLYQTANSKGLKWACVTGIAIAEATKPDATVDSVLGAIYDHCDKDLVVKRSTNSFPIPGIAGQYRK